MSKPKLTKKNLQRVLDFITPENWGQGALYAVRIRTNPDGTPQQVPTYCILGATAHVLLGDAYEGYEYAGTMRRRLGLDQHPVTWNDNNNRTIEDIQQKLREVISS